MSSHKSPLSRTGPGFYPMGIHLVGRTALVVGAGQLARPIVAQLIDFGAMVEIVAPQVIPEIEELLIVSSDKVSLEKRNFDKSDAEKIANKQYLLVFACTNSEEENTRVFQTCRNAGVLVDVAGSPDQSDFIVPSVIKRGHLKIAVATDGMAPALGRALKQRIQSSLGTGMDKYVLFISELREKLVELESLNEQTGNLAMRRKISRQIAESEEVFLALQRENFEEAMLLVNAIITGAREELNV